MFMNAFIGKPEKPADNELSEVLGPAKAHWDQIVAELAEELKINVLEWKSYSIKAGWALRLIHKKRAILYLSPSRDCFLASFALGQKAVRAARRSGLPKQIVKMIDEARKYAEGTAVRLVVKSPGDVDIVKKLAEIKLNN
jgi:hypothetical protein